MTLENIRWGIRYGLATLRGRYAVGRYIRRDPGYQWFLLKPGETPRTWQYVVREGDILVRCDDDCPLSRVMAVLTKKVVGKSNRREDGEWLGLKRQAALATVKAADAYFGHNPAIRADLVRACGLPAGLPHPVHWDTALAERASPAPPEEAADKPVS